MSKKKNSQQPDTAQELEPEVVTPGEDAPTIDLEALREEVSGILKERDELTRMLQHVTADFENYKKRNAQLRIDVQNSTRCDVIGEMLPVLDNLERALDAAGAESDALTKGVSMVQEQFIQTLTTLGVELIPTQAGTEFDPVMHNAVGVVPADKDHPDNTIFDVMQKGYRMGDKVIRYAMVRVAQK